MRWREREAAADPRANWHRWFAWHPVKIGKTTVWLETVERRLYWLTHPDNGHLVTHADYREAQP